MSFLKLVIFYFLEKWKKIFTGGYVLVRQKNEQDADINL